MGTIQLYATAVLIWGSTWFVIQFQLGEVPVAVSLVYRYLLAAGLLFGWCRLRRVPLGFDRRAHGRFAGLGVLLFGLNYLLAYHAQFHISSALNAIAFSSMVWMNLLNARLFLGTRIDRATLGGAALGVAGILILFWPEVENIGFGDETVMGAGLALAGAYVASLGNIFSQRTQRERLPVLQSNAWGMLYGALLMGAWALLTGQPFVLDTSLPYLLSLGYLALFGSVIAFGAYLTLLGRIGAQRAGYAAVMFPIVAFVLSALFEDLAVSGPLLIGTTVALLGNALILARGRRPADDADSAADGKTVRASATQDSRAVLSRT